MEHARRPTRRPGYLLAVLAATALAVGGGAMALVAQRGTGAADIVAGYFAALQRSDAPSALALGDLPAGSRQLLTSEVLQQQQRIAPIGHVTVGSPISDGRAVSVPVTFTLAFDGHPQPEATNVPVRLTGSGWRLARVAVSTELMFAEADRRATLLGAPVPVGSVLLFPGAAPVTFDTPYLQVTASSAEIDFQTGPTAELVTDVSPVGRARATGVVTAALRACLTGRGSPGCPLPDERYVPGSLRGTLASRPQLSVDVGFSDSGTIDVTGSVDVTGTYRRLDFRNRTVRGTGSVHLRVHAVAYATAPLTVVWQAS